MINSKHPGDVYNWIIKCIDSCITHQQHNSCLKLLDNWKKYYLNEYKYDHEYHTVLYAEAYRRWRLWEYRNKNNK